MIDKRFATSAANESVKEMSFGNVVIASVARSNLDERDSTTALRDNEARPDSHRDCFVVGLLAMTALQWFASLSDLADSLNNVTGLAIHALSGYS